MKLNRYIHSVYAGVEVQLTADPWLSELEIF